MCGSKANKVGKEIVFILSKTYQLDRDPIVETTTTSPGNDQLRVVLNKKYSLATKQVIIHMYSLVTMYQPYYTIDYYHINYRDVKCRDQI